ncbi:MFS transporter [Tenacibaculum jejuense]|uniref:Major Facilitator Superfamily protein n=1 Tax=Tenacibaculum jejuense TaxID=584609 RepID=A0A238U8W6_9FLAO|nr:MFS transporter [Tenacibaculum jejuense]SNR15436.1 Major Facilitator Superfamily protein [Tenacibaculum jejuense]
MKNYKKTVQIIFLILAAEITYALPFVLLRIFRPTFLEAFNITNKDIGICYTLYGITAVISYFFGGLITDKFKLKYLMSIALFLTSLGGFAWVCYPYLTTLYVLYIYWGFTTIMLFWSPLIKATRLWGGKESQILGFGLLEGGRGIVAALIGTIGVFILTTITSEENSSSLLLQSAMNKVYLITSALVMLVAFLILLLPNFGEHSKIKTTNSHKYNIIKALKYPIVWILMIIVLTSYIGFRIADIFTQYSSEVYGYNSRKSAELGTFISYIRPIICLLVIFFAKNSNPSKWLIIGFSIMSLGSFLFVFNIDIFNFSLLLPLVCSLIGVYTTRVLYFTVLEEAKIPITMTGTVVGIVSVIGFSPDIFLGPIEGYYLDEVGGVLAYQYLFIFFLASSLIGLFASILYNNSLNSKNKLLST